jgi:hypothetical protein
MRRSLVILFVGMFAVGIATAQIQPSGQCNRACLEGIADQYLAAMIAHDASKAPLAKGPMAPEMAGQERYLNRNIFALF